MKKQTPQELVAETPAMVALAERKARLDAAEQNAMSTLAELAAGHALELAKWREAASAARADLQAEPPAPEPPDDTGPRGVLETIRLERERWRNDRQKALGRLGEWFEEQWADALPRIQDRAAKLVEAADELAADIKRWHQQAREVRRHAHGGPSANLMPPAPSGVELVRAYSMRPSYDPLAVTSPYAEGLVLKDQEEGDLQTVEQAKQATARARLEANGRPLVAGARQ